MQCHRERENNFTCCKPRSRQVLKVVNQYVVKALLEGEACFREERNPAAQARAEASTAASLKVSSSA